MPRDAARASLRTPGLAMLVFLAGISCDPNAVGILEVASVQVSPQGLTFESIGDTHQLAAAPRSASNSLVNGQSITWSSGDPAVATVSAAGLVTAVGNGSTKITAALEGGDVSGSIDVVVDQVVTTVIVTLADDTLRAIDATTQASAEARDANGNAVAGAVATWVSTRTDVAEVAASGVVTAVADGAAGIRADVDGVLGGVILNVRQQATQLDATVNAEALFVGDTLTVSAAARDQNGYPVAVATVVWSVSDTTVLRDIGAGKYEARGAGSATLTAAHDALSKQIVVAVTPAPVANVTVSPAVDTVIVGLTATLAATLTDVRGKVLTDRAITWTSAAAGIASVDADGVVTGVAIGSTTISAMSEDSVGTATIVVVPPVDSVAVDPAADTMFIGQTLQLQASTFDAGGTPLLGRAVTWESSDSTVARPNFAGQVSGLKAGTVTLTATAEGVSGLASVTVLERVDSVVLAPDSLVLYPPNASGYPSDGALIATLLGASGATLSDRAIAWSSSDPLIVAVDDVGTVTALVRGTVTITATAEGIDGTAIVTVDSIPADTVVVTPSPDSVVEHETLQLSATVEDSAGNPLSGRVVAWESADTTIATVDAAGLVTGKRQGQTTITAGTEGVAGSATINVLPAPVDTVVVSPASASIWAPNLSMRVDSIMLAAEPRDSLGNPLLGRAVVWSSSDDLIATVDASGIVRSDSAGTVTITATVDGVGGTASVTVDPVPVASVVVSGSGTVWRDSTDQLVATVRDGAANPLDGWAVAWSSLDEAIATVDASGVVTGIGLGVTAIVASSEGVADTFALEVDMAPVVVDIAMGSDAGCAIVGADRVFCWGRDVHGEIGTSSDAVHQPTPIALPDSLVYTDITAGSGHVCVLDTAGDIRCWGRGSDGQLGNGVFAGSDLPVLVTRPGGVTFTAVEASERTTCALTDAFEAYCWGAADDGRLGTGGVTAVSTPQKVFDTGGAGFQQLAAMFSTFCALDGFGAAWCWGGGWNGQLGNGGTSNSSIPAGVAMPGTAFDLIRGGRDHLCALGQDGATYCWGQAWGWQLGNTVWIDEGYSTVPIQVVNNGEVFVDLALSLNTTCGIRADGSTLCWGGNYYGQFGNGTIDGGGSVPAEGALGLAMERIEFSRDYASACGFTQAGEMYCWGEKGDGILADGSLGSTTSPSLTLNRFVDAYDRSAWGDLACAITDDGGADLDQLFCWENLGQLVSGENRDVPVPTDVPLPAGVDPVQIGLGAYFACILAADGTVRCRGSNDNGQFGDNTTTSNTNDWATTINPAGIAFTDLAVGPYHTCAIGSDGGVYCWGDNGYGQFGNGTSGSGSTVPVKAATPVGSVFIDVGTGRDDVCALRDNGDLYCWGRNEYGISGTGSAGSAVLIPTLVTGGLTFRQFSMGDFHACAVTILDEAYCWGVAWDNRLGGSGTDQSSPQPVNGGLSFQGVFAAMGTWACGVDYANQAYCWGAWWDGETGMGAEDTNANPTLAFGGIQAWDLGGGASVGCIIDIGGPLYCSGRHEYGDTGLGLYGHEDTPMRYTFTP